MRPASETCAGCGDALAPDDTFCGNCGVPRAHAGNAIPVKDAESAIPLKSAESAISPEDAESAIPLETPGASTPLETPGASTPLENPGSSTPLENPGSSTPPENPGSSTPLETPGSSTPPETPGSSTPLENPGASTPLENPGSSTPRPGLPAPVVLPTLPKTSQSHWRWIAAGGTAFLVVLACAAVGLCVLLGLLSQAPNKARPTVAAPAAAALPSAQRTSAAIALPGTPASSTPNPNPSPAEVGAAPTPLGGGGGKIAFIDEGDDDDFDIYIANVDGSGRQRLTDAAGTDWEPAWSPEGERIVFSSNRSGPYQLYVMNADGSDQRRLTNNSGEERHPAWSPDGTRIAFEYYEGFTGDIWVMNSDGSQPTRLTYDPAQDRYPAWSPDGKRIVFSSERDGNMEIYVMDADGSRQTRLTINLQVDEEPAWSPDGARIAFSSNRDGEYQIYVMNADGSGQTRLTDTNEIEGGPAWSPDGALIAIDGLDTIRPDGSQRRTILSYGGDPAWQPRAARVPAAAVPTPASPKPTVALLVPTATSRSATPTPCTARFQFDPGVPQNERDVIQTGITRARDYFADKTCPTVYGYSNVDSLLEVAKQSFQASADELTYLRQQFESGTVIARQGRVLIPAGKTWQSQDQSWKLVTLAHEYFHSVQSDLSAPVRPRDVGPTWLTEGTAEYAGYLVNAKYGVANQEQVRREVVIQTRGVLNPLSSLDTRADSEVEDYNAVYNLGYLAVELLGSKYGGDPAWLDRYWRARASADSWQTAFQTAFGAPAQDFYRAFEEYRSKEFPPYCGAARSAPATPQAVPLSLQFVRQLTPGEVTFESYSPSKAPNTPYIFCVTGYAFGLLDDQNKAVKQPAGSAGWHSCGGNCIIDYMRSDAAPGAYVFAVQLPDGRKAEATFQHKSGP